MATLSPETCDRLIKRLQRIEGQTRGVCRMVAEDRDCQEILTQLAAIRGAAYQVSVMIIQEYAVNCLRDPEQHGSSDETMARLVRALGQMPH